VSISVVCREIPDTRRERVEGRDYKKRIGESRRQLYARSYIGPGQATDGAPNGLVASPHTPTSTASGKQDETHIGWRAKHLPLHICATLSKRTPSDASHKAGHVCSRAFWLAVGPGREWVTVAAIGVSCGDILRSRCGAAGTCGCAPNTSRVFTCQITPYRRKKLGLTKFPPTPKMHPLFFFPRGVLTCIC
jgi:hypothetical protein